MIYTIKILVFLVGFIIAVGLIILLRSGIGPSILPLSCFGSEEITLKRRKKLVKLKWSDIAAIFPFGFTTRNICHFHGFCFELKNGENIGFCIVSKNVSDTLTKLQNIFLDNLKGIGADAKSYDFPHPNRWREDKKRHLRFYILVSIISIIAMTVVGIINFKGPGPYLFPIPFVFLFIIITTREWLLSRQHKCLISFKVSENQLLWKDEYEQSQIKTFSDIENYCLDNTKTYLEFSDGTKLLDLEKLRYWPLLREHLLEKLESGKTGQNMD